MAKIRVIPVIDLVDGAVVRAIGGRRHKYRPIVSRLTPSCEAVDMARAFARHFALTELYVADLDGILGRQPALTLFHDLNRLGFQLWVDAGIRAPRDARSLIEAGVEHVVVGLETVAGPEAVAQLCREHGEERIAFSLDLKNGEPLGNIGGWNESDPCSIAAQAISFGVRNVIVLDLANVGMNDGTGTEALCKRLATTHPHVEIVAGGGVRGRADLMRLHECGVYAALVASALHDGRLVPEDLREMRGAGDIE